MRARHEQAPAHTHRIWLIAPARRECRVHRALGRGLVSARLAASFLVSKHKSGGGAAPRFNGEP